MKALGLAIASLCTAISFTFGDVVKLRSGRIEGKIIDTTDDTVVIQTETGRVTVKRSDVVQIIPGMTPRELYEAAAATVKDGDVQRHLALAEFCRQKGLQKEMLAEYHKVIAADPDNERARERLGYVRQEGRWVTKEELNRAKGLVLFRGQWVTPEYRQQTLLKETKAEYDRRLKALAFALSRGQGQAAAEIAKLRDPDAVEPLAILLRHTYPDVRRAAIQALGAIGTAEAVEALAGAAIKDDNERIRREATAALAASRPREAIAVFSQRLRSYTRRGLASLDDARLSELRIERIASAVGGLGDPLSIPLLIRMLQVWLNLVDDSGQVLPQAYFSNLVAANQLEQLCGEPLLDRRQAWLAWWADHGFELIGDEIDEQIDQLR